MREAGCSASIKYTFPDVMCSAAGLQLVFYHSSGDAPHFLWAGSAWKSSSWVVLFWFLVVLSNFFSQCHISALFFSALSPQKKPTWAAKHWLLSIQGEKTSGEKQKGIKVQEEKTIETFPWSGLQRKPSMYEHWWCNESTSRRKLRAFEWSFWAVWLQRETLLTKKG